MNKELEKIVKEDFWKGRTINGALAAKLAKFQKVKEGGAQSPLQKLVNENCVVGRTITDALLVKIEKSLKVKKPTAKKKKDGKS